MTFKKRQLTFISFLIVGTTALVFAGCAQLRKGVPPTASAREPWALPDPTPNDVQDYKTVIARIEADRTEIASRYQRANAASERAVALASARETVTKAIYREIFPAWYGTAWDFNGTTEAPRQGKIACGYFVSTVLRDAGWRVQRTRLAQQASENIILSLTTTGHIKRFRRVAIDDFVMAVKNWGSGVYVVGLDIHVGFIVNTGDEILFIHSSYVEPFAVVR